MPPTLAAQQIKLTYCCPATTARFRPIHSRPALGSLSFPHPTHCGACHALTVSCQTFCEAPEYHALDRRATTAHPQATSRKMPTSSPYITRRAARGLQRRPLQDRLHSQPAQGPICPGARSWHVPFGNSTRLRHDQPHFRCRLPGPGNHLLRHSVSDQESASASRSDDCCRVSSSRPGNQCSAATIPPRPGRHDGRSGTPVLVDTKARRLHYNR